MKKRNVFGKYFMFTLFLVLPLVWISFSYAASGITYHGRLIKPDGTPVTESNVQFRMQIRTPGTEDCLLYEEIQTHDLSATNGMFALSLGDGSGVRQDSNSWNIFDSFSNRKTFNFAAADCAGGTSFTPNPTDNRDFRVFFNDGTFAAGTWEALPVQTINFIPISIESYAVGGFPASSLLRVETAGTLGTTTPLTATQYAEILNLVNGNSSQYEKDGELNGSALPSLSSGQTVTSDGSGGWVATTPLTSESDPTVEAFAKASLPTCAAGEVLKSDGTSLSCVTDSAGTLPDIVTAGTYSKVTVSAKGLVTAGSQIDGDDITSGEIGGTTSIDTSGNMATSGSITSGSMSTRQLDLYDSDNSNFIRFLTPATGTLTTDYTLRFPASDGTNGQVLSTDGSGVLSWISPSSGSVVGVTGTSPISVDNTDPANPVISLSDTGTAGTYGSATEVPVFTTDAKGRVTAVTETTISGVSPVGSTLSTGEVWVGDGSNQAQERFIGVEDLKTLLGTQQIPTACTSKQTMIWSAVTDVFSCTDISITASQVSDLDLTDYVEVAGDTMTGALNLPSNGLVVGTNQLIVSGGNVGIGTTVPSVRLDVDGSTKVRSAPGASGFMLGDATGVLRWIMRNSGAESGSNSGSDLHFVARDDAGDPLSTPLVIERSSGNIGIGTVSPTQSLEVAGAIAATGAAGALSKDGLYLQNKGASLFDVGAWRSGINASELTFSTDSGSDASPLERMRIDKDGNVGIGTNDPQAELEVVGTIKATAFEGPLTATSSSIGDGSAASPSMTFTNDSNTGFYSSGADQIGISAGGSQVWNITTSSIVSPTTGGASMSSANGTAASPTFSFAGDTDTGWFRPAADTLAAATGGTERVRIASSGNVGIGTTNPAAPLTVQGTVQINNNGNLDALGSLTINADSDNNNTSSYMAFGVDAAERMRIDQNGKVGIGTNNPGSNLQIKSSGGNTNGLSIGSSVGMANLWPGVVDGFVFDVTDGTLNGTTGTDLYFRSGGTDTMIIESTGNVGIGTTDPSYKLHVHTDIGDAGGLFFNTLGRDSTGKVGLANYHSYSTTTDATNFSIGNANTTYIKVDAGMTNSGYGMGIDNTILRNYQSTGDSGTLADLHGMRIQYGHYNTDATATPVTTSAFGLIINPLRHTGSFQNMYDLYLGGGSGSATVTNRYGLYQASSLASNYFAGNVGIGTASPNSYLHVESTGSNRVYIKGNTGGGAPAVGAAIQLESNIDTRGRGMYLTTTAAEANTAWFTGVPYTGGGFQIGNSSIHDYNALNNSAYPGNARLFISNAGNVGIGTASPSRRLHVFHGVNADYAAQITNPGGTGHGLYINAGPNTGTTTYPLVAASWDGTSKFWVRSDGNYYFQGTPVSTKESKKNIQPFDESAIELLKDIQIVTYKYKQDSDQRADRIGFVANDENHVYDDRLTNNKTGYDVGSITGVLIKATQELYGICEMSEEQTLILKARVDLHDREIASLKKENEALKQDVQMLRAYICEKDPSATFCK